ncbi:MAG: tRNA modification GTPase MnmE [Lentisphaerae bacterium ADurb.Bin242]|nr:MAG: tRNA modification GTPase MnmE [Lentisphaerae bacterium ADurb.Bin242]
MGTDLNSTPSANRVHIGFFGRRNVGKSSIVNAVTGQDLAIVSEVKGTTTDPVSKAMELLPLGPVVIVDTPGIDDEGELGAKRIAKTRQVLNRIDVAVLIADARDGLTEIENELLAEFKRKSLAHVIVFNKSDLLSGLPAKPYPGAIYASAKEKTGIEQIKEKIGELGKEEETRFRIVGDLVSPSDFVVLVVPIDKAAPKGRLILPQQQTIRDLLESDAAAIVVKEHELRGTLEALGKKPRMVITDSQVFSKVSADTPKDILLTSFSILMARYKGVLAPAIEGVAVLDDLRDGDRVLITEGCTHHRQCDDIGTVKLPRWVRQYTGVDIKFEFSTGGDFPEDLTPYRLVIHCGGCMLTDREMRYRRRHADEQKVPMTNYGIVIAYVQGILKRSLQPFPELLSILED